MCNRCHGTRVMDLQNANGDHDRDVCICQLRDDCESCNNEGYIFTYRGLQDDGDKVQCPDCWRGEKWAEDGAV